MASSLSFGKFWIFHIYRNLVTDGFIRSVADVGAGSGIYVRFLRHCDETAHWKALEAWGPNIVNHHLKHQYDEVICGDVRYIDWAKAGGADAVICGDVWSI